ncbi:hypothetical protein ACFVYP_11665 [Kitasatospora sp. NPDC058201]|uniref:hypothetical protein n=1 Tax=Streptomycetaceae TaxID=2062 RepID=UPI002E7A7F39|nr:hypothetical protein [Streptomyces sp. BE303]MED7950649.1 hypothetical protein [Streptomyces sp. BE303]
MSRTRARLAATGTAVVLAVTGMSGAAVADTAPASTPSTGSAVVNSSTTFLKDQALNGIVVIPLPTAAPSYDSTTGISTTFPVTGGSANLSGYYGDIDLGGGLLFINVFTGKSATFKQLHFSVDSWQISGVPVGGTAPVALLDPAGDSQIGRNGAVQTLNTTDLQLDAAGAEYLDSKLKTSFFKAGQSVGTFALTFTQGS